MSRIYYNSGGAGRNHSKLFLTRLNYSDLSVVVTNHKGQSSASVVLNRDQIKDLIVQLEPLAKLAEPLIEGDHL